MPNTNRIMLSLVSLALVVIWTAGCGVTVSPVKRKPLEIIVFNANPQPQPQKISVSFEPTLPGKPLAQTVWDNVTGAFADEEESHRIGFTQDYTKLAPAAAGGAIGGMVVAATAATKPDYTRIVIPFGRIFEETFSADLKKAFPNALIADDQSPSTAQHAPGGANALVTVKVSEFQVWEEPLNHLNLRSVTECNCYQAGRTNRYTIRCEISQQSIGSVLTTSSGFISEMNKIADNFAEQSSQEILTNLQAGLH